MRARVVTKRKKDGKSSAELAQELGVSGAMNAASPSAGSQPSASAGGAAGSPTFETVEDRADEEPAEGARTAGAQTAGGRSAGGRSAGAHSESGRTQKAPTKRKATAREGAPAGGSTGGSASASAATASPERARSTRGGTDEDTRRATVDAANVASDSDVKGAAAGKGAGTKAASSGSAAAVSADEGKVSVVSGKAASDVPGSGEARFSRTGGPAGSSAVSGTSHDSPRQTARPAAGTTRRGQASSAPRATNPQAEPYSVVRTSGRSAPVSGTPYASSSQAHPRKRERGKRWPLIVALSVLCAVALAVGLFSWNRWLRCDDAADIQGTWQVSGSSAVVVIDDASIWVNDEVAYAYTIDTAAKTVSFSFGGLSGTARYWFSSDRSELILVDGDYTWFSTLSEDMGLWWSQVQCFFTGDDPVTLADDENATVLEIAESL